MYRVLILSDRHNGRGPIPWVIQAEGLSLDAGTEADLDQSRNGSMEAALDAVLLDLDSLSQERASRVVAHCRKRDIPVVAVVSSERLSGYDPSLGVDDFIMPPIRPPELLVRLDQAIAKSRSSRGEHTLQIGDLVVDTERYEVRVAGQKVILTYKEYQLLLLLGSNQGKVYTRDRLLSEVWGYDYFGGTRTVDVHIRRLRAKIEDANHSFIETIWNVGYRFKASP